MKETPVKDSLDVFVQGARINFEMWGKVLPVFGCNIDGEPMTLPVRFQTPDDKEKFRQKIIDLISKNKRNNTESATSSTAPSSHFTLATYCRS